MQQSTRPYAWRQWFHSQGLNVAHDMSGPRYELFSMLAQAACTAWAWPSYRPS